MWLILAVVGHIGNAFVFLADKAFIEKLYPHPKTLAFFAGASGIFLFPFFWWFLRSAHPPVIWSAIASGAVSIPAILLLFYSLKQGEVSRVVPAIGSIIPLFTFGLSHFLLGENMGGKVLVAFILLVLGGIFIEIRSFNNGVISRKAVSHLGIKVAAGILFALAFVLQKYAFEGTGSLSAFLWSRVGAVASSLPLLCFSSVREHLKFAELRGKNVKTGFFYVISRILSGISPLVILAAISVGSVTLVNALQGIQYAFLFILAIIFSKKWPEIFREEITRPLLIQKAAATILIIAGLALLV